MNFYAYIPTSEGKQPVGTSDQCLIRDLKTLKGVVKRLTQITRWNSKPFVIQTFTDVYKEDTYRTVYTHNPLTK